MGTENTVTVETTQVRCEGGGGASGHPAVYLSLGAAGTVTCPYCSAKFVLADGAKPAGH